MEWLQAPEGGDDEKRNSFVDVHPESKKLLSQIGLWQIVTGEEGGGGGGRFTSRNRGWPNEADDDTPSLTSEDERRYWDEVKEEEGLSKTFARQPTSALDALGKGQFEYEGVTSLPPRMHEWQLNEDLRGKLIQALDDLESADRRERDLVKHIASMQEKEGQEQRRLRRNLSELEAKSADDIRRIATLEEQGARQNAEIVGLRGEVDGLKGSLAKAEGDRDESRRGKERADEEVMRLSKLIEGMRESKEASTSEERTRAKDDAVPDATRELAASAALLQKQTAEMKNSAGAIAALKQEIQRLRALERQKAGQEVAVQQNERYKAELGHKDEQISRLRDQVVESQTALAKMRINGSSAHFPDTNHEAEKRELNERIVVLEAELSVMKHVNKRMSGGPVSNPM